MNTPRWFGVLSRTVAAVAGGYLLASLVAIACAMWLGPHRSEAVLTGMLLSFAVYAGAVIWVFAASDAWRAWAGLGIPTAVLGVVVFLAGGLA